ncbi:MAG: hypothetical protein ACYDAJ_08005 [Nitrosotalea sp.]
MTVNNAVRGLKNIIHPREEFIKSLDVVSKNCKDEIATIMVDGIKDFLTRDIGGFEWILE